MTINIFQLNGVIQFEHYTKLVYQTQGSLAKNKKRKD